jgi:hypothetical protein
MNFAIDRSQLLENFSQFIRRKYVLVFLFNFILRLIIKLPIYVVASIVYDESFSMLDHYADIAMTWYVGLPLKEARQFIFMPFLIQVFSLNFLISPYLTWLMIEIMGYSVGFAVIFHLLDTQMEGWGIKKPENFFALYIFSNLLFPVSYLKWTQAFGLLLMLVSLSIYFMFEDKLHFSLIFAILSALTHFYGWVFVSILFLYAYKDIRYLQFFVPTLFVLLQFLFFYIRTGDFFLYFHALEAYGEHEFYPFGWMITYWANLTTDLYLAIVYISQLLSIAVTIFYLYYYIKNKHLDRLNLLILVFFLFVQLISGPGPRELSRYFVLILPFCVILLLCKFMSDVSTKTLTILVAFLFVVNIFLIWYLIIADFLNVSDLGVIYEKASNYLLRKIS